MNVSLPRTLSALSLCLLCVVWLPATARPAAAAEAIPVDGFVAAVNTRVITLGEVLAALQPVEQQLRATHTGRDLAVELEAAYERVLNTMIEQALILEDFARRDAQMPEQAVDQHIQMIVARNFGGDRGALLRELAAEGIGMEEWRKDVRERLAVMAMHNEEVSPNVVVSPRQLRQAYEQQSDRFRQAAETHVRMITLLRTGELETDPAERAAQVHARLLAGADFAEVARECSQDARAERGGDRGWIDPGSLRRELATAIAALEPGAVSEPVDTPDAFYIVKVEDRRPERVIPFDEVRDELAAEVRRAEEERIYQAWMDRLRQRHHVQRFDRPEPADAL